MRRPPEGSDPLQGTNRSRGNRALDSPVDAVDAALREVESARKRTASGTSRRVTQSDALDYLRSVAYAWFNSHRLVLQDRAPTTELSEVDSHLDRVLVATGRASARTTYVSALKDAKSALIDLRSAVLAAGVAPSSTMLPWPDFSPLASDAVMRDILRRSTTSSASTTSCIGASCRIRRKSTKQILPSSKR